MLKPNQKTCHHLRISSCSSCIPTLNRKSNLIIKKTHHYSIHQHIRPFTGLLVPDLILRSLPDRWTVRDTTNWVHICHPFHFIRDKLCLPDPKIWNLALPTWSKRRQSTQNCLFAYIHWHNILVNLGLECNWWTHFSLYVVTVSR